MAITQTGTTIDLDGPSNANAGTVSTTISVPADAELILVGAGNYNGATANFMSGGSMTFTKGGVDTAMTAVTPSTRGDGSTGAWMTAMFYMVSPDTGTNKSLKYDWSGTGLCDRVGKFTITFWKGVNTSTPVRASGGGQGGAGPPFTTNSFAALSGDLIVAVATCFNGGAEGTANTWSGLSTLTQLATTGSLCDGAWATGIATGTQTVALSTATNWEDGGIVAVALVAAAGGATEAPFVVAGTTAIAFGSPGGDATVTDRLTTWSPGVTRNGGIPNYTNIHSTLSPAGGGADNKTAIQNAINAAGAAASVGSPQVVKLNAGNYNMSGAVLINFDYVVLRGSGAGTTRLIKTGSTAASGGGGGSAGPAVTLSKASTLNLDSVTTAFAQSKTVSAGAGNGDKGTTTVTLNNITGLSAGQLVRVDRASNAAYRDDPRLAGSQQVWASSDYMVTWNKHNPVIPFIDDLAAGEFPTDTTTFYNAYTVPDRAVCEMKEIASVGGSAVTFTTPLHTNYRSTESGKVSLYNGTLIQRSGVEDLTAFGFDRGTFEIGPLAKSCWVKNCEVDGWFDKPFNFIAAWRCETRGCYQHGTPWPSNSAENYAFIFNWASADCLVEDCISIMCDKVTAARAAGAGCVFGYNYLDMGFIGDSFGGAGWVEVHANASHFTGPHHVLFEGNYAANADSDFTHGNSTYITHFRNHYSGFRHSYTDPGSSNVHNDLVSSDGVKRCGGITSFGYWHSFVGNVLGLSGQMSTWMYSGNSIFDDKSVWLLGWDPTQQTGTDPKVVDSGFAGHVLRAGNWDWKTSTQKWEDGTSVVTLPNSYYLSGKPKFFGANAWPWVNPTTGATTTLPAKARWDANTPNVVTADDGISATEPVVTNVSPNTGPYAGGTSVTITGTNFTGATAVSFGGIPAASFTVVNDTTITATTPAH